LLLIALGGYTAMVIVALLQKFDTPPVSLNVELAGENRADHPKSFTSVTVIYQIEGEISPEKAWKAVTSSYSKYSVVANSLQPELKYRVILNGKDVTGKK
jgi:putative redox protein